MPRQYYPTVSAACSLLDDIQNEILDAISMAEELKVEVETSTHGEIVSSLESILHQLRKVAD